MLILSQRNRQTPELFEDGASSFGPEQATRGTCPHRTCAIAGTRVESR